MEATDTVMDATEIGKIFDSIPKDKGIDVGWTLAVDAIRLAQAEISFKAGIREVVEWITETSSKTHLSVYGTRWQAKLKEWGL